MDYELGFVSKFDEITDCSVEMGLLKVPYEKLSLDQLSSHATALNKRAEKRNRERIDLKNSAINWIEDTHREMTNGAYDELVETRKKVIEFRRQKVDEELALLEEDFAPILERVVSEYNCSDTFNLIPKFREKDLKMNDSDMEEYAKQLVEEHIEDLCRVEEVVEPVMREITIDEQVITMIESDVPVLIRVLKKHSIEFRL